MVRDTASTDITKQRALAFRAADPDCPISADPVAPPITTLSKKVLDVILLAG